MKNKFCTFTPFLLLVAAILACSAPSAAPTPAAIPPEPPIPPFVGMWMSKTETLVFTQKNLYRVDSNAETSHTNEQFEEIIEHDAVHQRISVRTQWIKVNGISVGFDAPVYSISYKVEGDVMQIGLGTADEFTSELSPTIYYRK